LSEAEITAGETELAGAEGSLATKADDLAAYREGRLRMTTHEPEALQVKRVTGEVFLVALRARLAGACAGAPFPGIVRPAALPGIPSGQPASGVAWACRLAPRT
jgi:hypothetical protein